MKRRKYREVVLILWALQITEFFSPQWALAGLESSLVSLKMKLTGVILPLLSVIGIGIAGISFYTGNQNAKQHALYAVLGCMLGFGAQAIVDFISQTVH